MHTQPQNAPETDSTPPTTLEPSVNDPSTFDSSFGPPSQPVVGLGSLSAVGDLLGMERFQQISLSESVAVDCKKVKARAKARAAAEAAVTGVGNDSNNNGRGTGRMKVKVKVRERAKILSSATMSGGIGCNHGDPFSKKTCAHSARGAQAGAERDGRGAGRAGASIGAACASTNGTATRTATAATTASQGDGLGFGATRAANSCDGGDGSCGGLGVFGATNNPLAARPNPQLCALCRKPGASRGPPPLPIEDVCPHYLHPGCILFAYHTEQICPLCLQHPPQPPEMPVPLPKLEPPLFWLSAGRARRSILCILCRRPLGVRAQFGSHMCAGGVQWRVHSECAIRGAQGLLRCHVCTPEKGHNVRALLQRLNQ